MLSNVSIKHGGGDKSVLVYVRITPKATASSGTVDKTGRKVDLQHATNTKQKMLTLGIGIGTLETQLNVQSKHVVTTAVGSGVQWREVKKNGMAIIEQ